MLFGASLVYFVSAALVMGTSHRVLHERAAQRRRKCFSMEANLAMVYNTALALVNKFDGVLDRYDMAGIAPVDVIDHCWH